MVQSYPIGDSWGISDGHNIAVLTKDHVKATNYNQLPYHISLEDETVSGKTWPFINNSYYSALKHFFFFFFFFSQRYLFLSLPMEMPLLPLLQMNGGISICKCGAC